MKNYKKVWGATLTALLVIGFAALSMTGCDNGTNGTTGGDPITSTAALETAISDANAAKEGVAISDDGEDVHTSQKWVTQADLNTLNAAIEAAQTAKTNSTTQTQITNAASTLNTAIGVFNGRKANGLSTTALVYTALDTAISNANTAKEGVVTSANGSNVDPSQQWVTQTVLETLNTAITTAQTARANAETQGEVDSAVTTLNAAVGVFNGEKKAGTQSNGGDDPDSLDITVNFIGITDETINLGNVNELSSGGSLTVTVSGSYASYAWYVDGVEVPGNATNEIVIQGAELGEGAHTVTAIVVKDGVPFSKVLKFEKE